MSVGILFVRDCWTLLLGFDFEDCRGHLWLNSTGWCFLPTTGWRLFFFYHLLRYFRHVNFLVFLCLFVVDPVISIFFAIFLKVLELRHQVCNGWEKRYHDVVHEPRLWLSDLSRSSVAQEWNWQILSLLSIALIEEFFKQEPSPSECGFKWANLSWDIWSVNCHLNKLLLRVKFLCSWLPINQGWLIHTTFNVLCH